MVTSVMGVAYINLSAKSDYSQTLPSRSAFDYQDGGFQTDVILKEFKQIGFIGLIGCFILKVAILP